MKSTKISERFGTTATDTLLKGALVVSAGKREVWGVIADVRESPEGFGAPLLIDFDSEVLEGVTSWPCNITETRKLGGMIHDDYEQWKGWGLVIGLCKKNNPQRRQEVDSLEVVRVVDPTTAAAKRSTPPKYPYGKRAAANGKHANDEIPF